MYQTLQKYYVRHIQQLSTIYSYGFGWPQVILYTVEMDVHLPWRILEEAEPAPPPLPLWVTDRPRHGFNIQGGPKKTGLFFDSL